jgi:hypothetical protein
MEVIASVSANASANSASTTTIFRYKLSDETMSLIAAFSKLHQYADRHAYKDAWVLWLNENRDFVTREEMRLKNVGFNGDVIDKMFKAGRYYFREKKEGKEVKAKEAKEAKEAAAKEAKEAKEAAEKEAKNAAAAGANENKKQKNKNSVIKTKTTRNYIPMNCEFIKAVDAHLKKSIKAIDFKPQTSFIQFVEENKDILQIEVRRLNAIIIDNSGGIVGSGNGGDRKTEIHKEIMTKLKKTFKNRYFVMPK